MYEFLLWSLIVVSTGSGERTPRVIERFTSLEHCVTYQKTLPASGTNNSGEYRTYSSRCVQGYVLIPGASGPDIVKSKAKP